MKEDCDHKYRDSDKFYTEDGTSVVIVFCGRCPVVWIQDEYGNDILGAEQVSI